ncbi:MAG: hypothetical protein AB7Y46_11200 [Armatimonadota bacterium]
MRHRLMPLNAALAVLVALPALAQEPLIVRYVTWMIVPPVKVAVESRPYGELHDDYTYRDQPAFRVLSLAGETLSVIDGRLGEITVIPAGDTRGGEREEAVLLRLEPGNNYSVPRPESDQFWYVATPDAPLNVVGGFEELYFWLPPGLSAGTVLCHAFSVGEAGRLMVTDLEGNLLGSLESDFNEPEALLFRVPEADRDAGTALRLSLLPPDKPEWTIDDARLWLGAEIPGLLAPNREALGAIPALAERLGIGTNWVLVRDFENANPIATVQWSQPVPAGAELPTYEVGLSDQQAVGGARSLRVALRLPEDMIGSQELKLFTEPLEVPGVAAVRFFLHGDGSGRRLTVRVRDATEEHHYVDAGAIDWHGWKTVVADFEHQTRSIAGGDENRRIDGPPVSVVLHIQHARGNPAESVLFVDDLAIIPPTATEEAKPQ